MEEIDSNLSSSPNSESEWELLPDQKPESKVSNRHWNKLRNIFNASCKLSRYNAEEVHDVSALIRSLQKIPTNRAYQLKKNLNISSLQQAFDNHKTEELFYRTIEKGDPNEIFIITKIIDADPYKFLRPVSHPDSIFNRKNRLGYTPLYIACRNGNLEYVEFFLKNEANWLILSENESCLEVAARWGFEKIVKALMSKTWNKKSLKSAKKNAASLAIKNLLKTNSKKGCKCWGFS